MSADEDENEKVVREKTDGGLTLLGEGVRQDKGAAPHIRRLALTPPGSTLDRNSVMDSIVETLQLFTKDSAGAAHAPYLIILDTQPLSMDNKIILNGPHGTIHRATEVSHTSVEFMQMFDAMVECRNHHGGVDVLGIPLYFVLPMRATEMAAENMGVAPPAQHVFMPSYIIECSGMGLGLSDVNLDEIGTTVRAALGGLKVATTMRCRIRDGITGTASQ